MDKKDLLHPCIHCAIRHLVIYRMDNGVVDDPVEIMARMSQCIADIIKCAPDGLRPAVAEGVRIGFAANIASALDGTWKGGEDAGPGQSHH